MNQLYRVRDRNDPKGPRGRVWGENLTKEDAQKLVSEVIGKRLSKTARMEPMTSGEDLSVAETTDPADDARAASGIQYSLDDGDQEVSVPKAGVVRWVLPGHELVVNGDVRPYPTAVEAGDRVMARPVDPQIIAARARALAAARQATPAKPRRQYRDVTVRPREERTAPAPRDRTVAEGLHVRLTVAPAAPAKPLPSPLKVAIIPDGAPMDDLAIGDDQLHDLTPDLGGGASDADLEYARRQHDAERQG